MPGKRRKYSLGSKAQIRKMARAYVRKKYRTGGVPVTRGAYNMRMPSELKLSQNQTLGLTTLQNTPTIANNQLILLNSIAQGTDYTTRIGRTCLATSLQWNLELFQAPGTTTSNNQIWVRAMVFCDRQPNGVEPSVFSDVLDSTFRTEQAFRNLSNRDRFVIVANKVWSWSDWNTLQPESLGCAKNGGPKRWAKYKKLNVEKTVYSGTSGGITNVQSCALFFAIWLVNTSGAVQANFAYRLRFVDF
ncbi:coat protein [Lake Sarah-associated circular virus-40]|uniref:coat protein n=1 Tax=Lake Sarah-associated circular virus-40 TaxID=1685769 RepID=UPI0007778550|nr:coat protein [Lake Sarah-associated circular virus-40]ALE29770.1 coat protein [Lake Sarah-associated circular virus-40]ALE29772.1 coat protein [Lake Sarah-associated circular virus-40]